MRTRRRSAVLPIVAFLMLALITAGCCRTCCPNPDSGQGPDIGPIIDVDTNGGPAKYFYTRIGSSAAEILNTRASFEIHPDLAIEAIKMKLIDTSTHQFWPETSLEITFDDNSSLLARSEGGELKWTCKDKNGASNDLKPVYDAELYVADCMKGSASKITMGGHEGNSFEMELKH